MVLLHNRPGNRKITMATLIEASGLNERRVRRCINDGLVEGARGKGQAAYYSETTLRKLKLISMLMNQKVEPLGREPTLPEIKKILELLTSEQEEGVLAGVPFSFVDTGDTDEAVVVDTNLNREYLDIQRKAARGALQESDISDLRSLFASTYSRNRINESNLYHGDLGEFGQLLKMLHEKLEALISDEREPDTAGEDTWVRVRTRSPVLEIHVRSPRSATDRAELKAVKSVIEELMRRGHGPYYD